MVSGTALPPHRTHRVSLTKTQLRTELGAELLSLCESVTADGVVSPEETEALRQWLEDSADADLPGVSYLREVVSSVIADGRITADECREVYRAVEKVLPPEVRRQAVSARRSIEAADRARARAERERNSPVAAANFMVAGVRYEGRPAIISKYVRALAPVYLVREPNNRYSKNAIAVRLEHGQQIGYVPEEDATELAPVMDDGAQYVAYVTKILTGGRSPIPVVQARLYAADATIADGRPVEIRAGSSPPSSSSTHWLLWLIAVGLLFVLIAFIQ